MQDGQKAVWSIPCVSVALFPSLKQNFIAYSSSKVSDCIFEIHQLWQSGFSRVYSNCNPEQVPAATPHKTPTVRPPAPYHENYSS